MARIIKTEPGEDKNSGCFLIDFGNGMRLWFDAWKDSEGEVTGDWNKYIFFTDNPEHMRIKAFQEAHNDEAGAYNYAEALSTAQEALEALDPACEANSYAFEANGKMRNE